jgi:ankyrin repeat protein
MIDKDELKRRRAMHPHDWSLVDSWAKYIATQDIRVLQDEITTNPESDVVKGLLYFAFGDHDIRVLELLEQSGVSFQEGDDPWSIDSVLCNAIENGGDCPEVVCWLMDRGASPVRCTMNRWTPLHLAAIRDYPLVMTALLERGVAVDIGTEIDGNWTPLMEACRTGSVDAVALLLEHRADVNRCCGMVGDGLLEIANKNRHPKIVAMLDSWINRNRS